MIERRNLLWIVPLFMIVTFPIWKMPLASFLAPRGGFDPNFGKHDEDVQNFVMEHVVILQNQEGHKTAEIKADQALTTSVPNEFILLSVDADLLDEKQDVYNVKAKTGIYNTETRLLVLKRDVRVTYVAENRRLYSEELHYFDKERTIISPGPVRMTADGVEVKGERLDYDIKTGQYQIGGRVFCTLTESPPK